MDIITTVNKFYYLKNDILSTEINFVIWKFNGYKKEIKLGILKKYKKEQNWLKNSIT